MAQYATLKAAIDAVIKANGQREITGTVLNQTLNAMVNSLGANYQLAGVATPSTNPGTPDQNVFYLAFEAGTYTNFNATVLPAGISILMWNGSWSSQTFYTIDATPTASSNNLVSSGAVFDAIKTDGSAYDVSAHFPTAGPNNDGKFTLEYILSNANTLIPAAWRKGGMSIRFVSSSDNKYVQARCMAQNFTTDTTQWAIAEEGVYVENPEFIYVKTDAEGKILFGIKVDGEPYFGVGCPEQVKEYVEQKIADLSLDEYEDIIDFLSDYLGSDTTLKVMIDGINSQIESLDENKLDAEGLDPEALGTVQAVENPEYIQVITDSEDKIIEATRKDGKKVFYGGVEGVATEEDIEALQEEIESLYKNILYGKHIYWFGDSLVEGFGQYPYSDKFGWATPIQRDFEAICDNQGVSGASIRDMTSVGKDWIVSHLINYINALPSDSQIDYIIWEGGVNDVDTSSKYGNVDTNTFVDYPDNDTDYVTSALENLCSWLQANEVLKKKGTKYGMIISYTYGNGVFNPEHWNILADKIIQALNKWGIPYLDLRKCGGITLCSENARKLWATDLVLKEYNPNNGYGMYATCKYNNEAYRTWQNIPAPAGQFDPSKWEKMTGVTFYTDYNSDAGYSSDQRCYYDEKVYRAKQAIPAPAGEWDASKWDLISDENGYDRGHINRAAYDKTSNLIANWIMSL